MFRGVPGGGAEHVYAPIPELSVPDADITVVFLSGNGIIFSQATDDGWYRATTPVANATMVTAIGDTKVYRANEEASPMGCVERWQWCNSALPRHRGCGNMSSFLDSVYSAAPLFNLSDSELSNPERPSSSSPTGRRFIWPAFIVDKYPVKVSSIIGFLGTKSLDSQSRLTSGTQFPILANQWHFDVTHWFTTILSSLQSSFTDVVIGNRNLESRPPLVTPENEQEQNFCKNQVIYTPT